jgi:hypothetical protein
MAAALRAAGCRLLYLRTIMVIIARGRGVLAGVVAFFSLIAAEFLTERHFHDGNYYQMHGWPKLAGFAVAAMIVGLLGPRNAGDERAYLSPGTLDSTERRSVFRDADSFFLIPVRYWPWILCALGIIFFVASGLK